MPAGLRPRGWFKNAPIKRVRLKARSEKRTKKTTILLDDRFGCWHQPIVPGRLQPSIVGTSELNFCVRNGNRWTLVVINTNYFVSASSDGLVDVYKRQGEESVAVLKKFSELKCALMPYMFSAAVNTHKTGVPTMRAMVLEFPGDIACEDLDRQYMLGDSLLVAPVFTKDGDVTYYLPDGKWTHLLSNETKVGGRWMRENLSLIHI